MSAVTPPYLPVDLHLHSTASDGALTPTKLIERAAYAGLSAIALTDHDTMAGVEEALEAGRRCGLEVVRGVELSVIDEEQEIHLLGYDPLYPEKLSAVLQEMRRDRYRRIGEMAARLRRQGIPLQDEEIITEAEPAAPGRLHLARLLVKRGYCAGINEAFSTYLKRGRPAYVSRQTLEPGAAIAALHCAGAVPVVAHPGEKGRARLRKLVELGLRGVEIFHPDHSPELVRYYRHQAARMNLLVTGGSDFHSDDGYQRSSLGAVTVPYHCLAALKEAPRGI